MPRYSVRGMESVAAVEAADEIAAELATVLARFTALATGPDAGGGVAADADRIDRIALLEHRPHRAGGPTSLANGRGVCARGNYVREMPGWRVDLVDDGLGRHPHTVRTTTPTGHTYTSTAGPALRRVEETGCYSSSSPTSCTGSPPSMSSRPPEASAARMRRLARTPAWAWRPSSAPTRTANARS